MKRLAPYLLFAGAIDSLAIVFYVNTLRMPKAAYQMPRILIALVLLLSVLMIVEQLLQMRKPPSADNGNGLPEEISPLRIGVFVSLILAYVLTIVPLGYFIATPAFLIGSLLFSDRRSRTGYWRSPSALRVSSICSSCCFCTCRYLWVCWARDKGISP